MVTTRTGRSAAADESATARIQLASARIPSAMPRCSARIRSHAFPLATSPPDPVPADRDDHGMDRRPRAGGRERLGRAHESACAGHDVDELEAPRPERGAESRAPGRVVGDDRTPAGAPSHRVFVVRDVERGAETGHAPATGRLRGFHGREGGRHHGVDGARDGRHS